MVIFNMKQLERRENNENKRVDPTPSLTDFTKRLFFIKAKSSSTLWEIHLFPFLLRVK